MAEGKVTIARLEATAPIEERRVRVTFNIEYQQTSFQLPITLDMNEFDDTEMIQAARDILHRMFVELADESKRWELTSQERKILSEGNLRPKLR